MNTIDMTGITPINNGSAVARTLAAAERPDVLDAASRGRGLIKAGDLGYDIQRMFDELERTRIERHDLGSRPKAEGAIPSIPDPRFPFNGDTVAGVLRKAGMQQDVAAGVAPKLARLTPVLPELRSALRNASPSSRMSVLKGAVAVLEEALTIVHGWEPEVQASVMSDAVLMDYDHALGALDAKGKQLRDSLRMLSPERVESYKLAVQNAITSAKLAELEAAVDAASAPKTKAAAKA